MTRLANRAHSIVVEFVRTAASVESVECRNCSMGRAVTSQAIILIATASRTSLAAWRACWICLNVKGSVLANALEDCFAFRVG